MKSLRHAPFFALIESFSQIPFVNSEGGGGGGERMEGPGDKKYCFKQWPLVLRQYLRCYVESSPRFRP